MQYSASTSPIYSPLSSPSHISSSTLSTLRLQDNSVDPFSEVQHLSSSRITPQRTTRQADIVSDELINLIKLESELKCSVCKDFYDTPLSSKCQHTFCAGCAKFDYNNKSTGLCCPICGNAFTSFAQFYKNTLIEDLIKEYKNNRGLITRLYALGQRAEEKERREEKKGSAKAIKSFKTISNSNSDSTIDTSLFGEKTKSKCVSERSVNKNDSDSNEQKNKRKRMEGSDNESLLPNKNLRSSIKPLCKKPKVVYGLMNERKLRSLLKEEGLSANGSKNEMITRHSYFINLYNSNVDATNPKTKGELLRDMKKWEKAQQSDEAKDANLLKKALTNPEEIGSYDILFLYYCF